MSSDRPRTRAPRRSPDERRAQIADVARAIAVADGLSAVTLRAVAKGAGVAPALVAHYEPAMDALVARVFAGIVADELEEVAGLAAGLAPRAALEAIIATLLGGARADVTAVWVEAWALGRRSEALAAEVRAQMDAWAALLRRVIEAGVATGDFSVDDAGAAAWQLLGMIDGLGAQALVRWGGVGERSELLLRAAEGMLGVRRGG
ncbi:TetR/AcrR family transcriptional regulator [Microbacterium sp. NPDC055683]